MSKFQSFGVTVDNDFVDGLIEALAEDDSIQIVVDVTFEQDEGKYLRNRLKAALEAAKIKAEVKRAGRS